MILDEKVRSVMQTDVRTISADAPASVVRRLLDGARFHHLPVLEGARLVGILSAIDLARVSFERWVPDAETRDAWLDQFRARDVMTALPDVLHPDDSVRLAAERLGDGAYHALPVVDAEGHLVGIVTSTDLVRLLYAHLRG